MNDSMDAAARTQDSVQFVPSPSTAFPSTGPRDVGLVFIGSSQVVGIGDPKGQGWVGRVIGRTSHPDLQLTAYNLGVRSNTSADILERWFSEAPARWIHRDERRVVVSLGTADVAMGVSIARHRLNLANLLDDAASKGIGAFVVGPPPTSDPEINAGIEHLAAGQADVCARRNVAFVDCYTPLKGHAQWEADLAASTVPNHPGQAGYGLIAWLVLHHGWYDWLGIAPDQG